MRHHDDAVARYVARESADDESLAVIVSGSVARGSERADSDVDLYLVVSEERWDAAVARRALMYTETEGIEYPGGYFDVKLATLSYLDDAAERGDDPVRDSLARSVIAFSRIPDLAERIARIGDPDSVDWDARIASFVAQARLHGGYFLRQGFDRDEKLLIAHASLHLASSACRLVLAANRILYSGAKYLAAAAAGASAKPEGFDELIAGLLAEPSPLTADPLLAAIEAFAGSSLPADQTLSTFILDNELAWRYRTPTPEYS